MVPHEVLVFQCTIRIIDEVNDRDQRQAKCDVCVSEVVRAEEQIVSGNEENIREM